MNHSVPKCEAIHVVLFRGDRSGPFGARIKRELDDQKHGRGPGPSVMDCLLWAGHTGVSTDGEQTIYGFNPDATGTALWQLMEGLQNGDAFRGIVTDNTLVFTAARLQGLAVRSFRVILPEPVFRSLQDHLDAEKQHSQYTYGFPNGDGDCNCTTWLEAGPASAFGANGRILRPERYLDVSESTVR